MFNFWDPVAMISVDFLGLGQQSSGIVKLAIVGDQDLHKADPHERAFRMNVGNLRVASSDVFPEYGFKTVDIARFGKKLHKPIGHPLQINLLVFAWFLTARM